VPPRLKTNKPIVVEPDGSWEELISAFYRVRGTIHDLFAQVGADANKTRESARLLGLSRQLTWRLARVVCTTEPEAVLGEMPGRLGISRFTAACRKRGASEESVRAALDATAELERAIDALTGSRKSLSAFMANQGKGSTTLAHERERRKLFEGGSAVWGAQAKVRFVSVFLFPASDGASMIDVGHVTGYVGFRRLRQIPWLVSYEAVRSREGAPVRFQKQPLDPEGSSEGQLQLIKRFCEPANPEILVSTVGDFKRFELAAGPVGNAGQATVVFGTYLRHLFPRLRSAEHSHAGFTVLLETPVERIIFDMFVHRDIMLEGVPPAHLCARLNISHFPSDEEITRRAMPVVEKPFALGRGATGALTAHIPWYQRLVSFVCERIGHDPEAFSGSRFEMTYPPIPTVLLREFPLEAGGSVVQSGPPTRGARGRDRNGSDGRAA